MDNTQLLQNDILRYKKNKLPANLALLGLVFNCLYFCLLYAVKLLRNPADNEPYWYASILIGASVVLTLVTLLVAFLSSEGIKGYNKKYCIPLLVLAVWEIVRIFIYPLYSLQNNLLTIPYFWIRPTNSVFEFTMMVIWLCASAACFAASAILGYINCVKLEKHIKAIESGEINMDAVFEEERKAIVAGSVSQAAEKVAEEVE